MNDRTELLKHIDRALKDTLELLTGDCGEIEAGFWNKTIDNVERAIESLESLMEEE